MNSVSTTTYTDLNSLAELKARAAQDPQGSLDKVAQQFESLMMHQMLKSMREANLGDGILDSDQSLFYRDMLDQQMAVHLAESGGMGLADVIKRQLGGEESAPVSIKSMDDYRRRTLAMAPPAHSVSDSQRQPGGAQEVRIPEVRTDPEGTQPVSLEGVTPESFIPQTPDEFVERLWPWAEEAAAKLGMPPQMLLAQAALESGWGKHTMRHADGNPANNLFGIKADRRWDGDRVSVPTLEYEGGVAVRKKAQFRAYDSYRQSFLDYVDFLQADPRYTKALQSATDPQVYFQELQKAGYATDPNYAVKVVSLLEGDQMNSALLGLKRGTDGSI